MNNFRPAPSHRGTTQPVDNSKSAYLRHYRRNRTTPVPHGTQNGYANWSCRCDRCRAAHRDYNANWRAGQ